MPLMTFTQGMGINRRPDGLRSGLVLQADAPQTLALVYNADGQTSAGAGAVAWPSEAIDRNNWHNGTNPERLTVLDRSVTYVRPVAQTVFSAEETFELRKNNASYAGSSQMTSSDFGSPQNCAGAIVPVSTGDYFSTYVQSGFSTVAVNENWMGIEKIDPTTKMARVSKTANQTAAVIATNTTATWATEDIDTDGFFNSGTSTTRLTVPSGVTLVRLCASLKSVSSTVVYAYIIKNGAFPIGSVERRSSGSVVLTTGPLVVTPGDYFEIIFQTSTLVAIEAGDKTWFQIEEVPSTIKRCLAYVSTNQTANNTTPIMPLGAELYDTDNIHDNVTNNSRLTAPAGVTQARLTFYSSGQGTAGDFRGRVYKNGTTAIGLPMDSTDMTAGNGLDALNGMGAWIDCVPGDYFELALFSTNSRTIAANFTWLCAEFR